MNERLKHRLVGAAVLVSVVVILVPMVLKPPSEVGKSVSLSSVTRQAQGSFDAGNRASGAPQHSHQPGEQDTAPSIQSRQRRAVEEANKLPNGKNANEVILTESAVDGAGAVPVPQTNRRTPLRQNGIRVTGLKGEVISLTAPSDRKRQAWVVQLGSFSKRGNAVALRDRLQAQGYPAFVRPTAARETGLTRVYVGPEISREEARQLSRALGKETQLSGLVVPYP